MVVATRSIDMTTPPKSVSLVLGSGGARGLAHIGVIQWLTENGYEIRSISGSSMGALVGGIYAARKLQVYAEWVSALERAHVIRLLDPSLSRRGLFKGERIIGVLRELIGDCEIADLPLSYTAVATDIESGEEVWLREGRLFDAIRASMATPLVFTPFKHGGRTAATPTASSSANSSPRCAPPARRATTRAACWTSPSCRCRQCTTPSPGSSWRRTRPT